MNTVNNATPKDFMLQKMQSGKNKMLLSSRGLTICLFYAPNDNLCKHFIPQYINLSSTINSCNFMMCNLALHNSVIHMSNQTNDPLKVIPSIIIYNNSRPLFQYEGEYTMREVGEFINYSIEFTAKKEALQSKGYSVQDPNNTVGSKAIPYLDFKCDDNFCYVPCTEAYCEKKEQ